MLYKSLSLLLFLALASCTSKFKDSSTDQQIYRGDLVKALDHQYGTPEENNLSAVCDNQVKTQKYEIARELEARRAGIEKWSLGNKGLTDASFSTEKAGALTLKVYPSKKNASEWQTWNWGDWPSTIRKFNQIKTQTDFAAWTEFNEHVRTLVSLDEQRVIYWASLDLHHDEGDKVLALKKIVDACIASDCEDLIIGSELKGWALGKLHYQYYLAQIQSKSGSARSRMIGYFGERMKRDFSRFSFFKNSLVEIKNNSLVVPMQANLFGGERAKIENATAQKWSRFGLNVVISWREQSAVRFVLEAIGYRSFVDFEENEMHLPSVVNVGILAHEFGHILGFRDRYHTLFNEQTCKYTAQVNPGDIMSVSGEGDVLEEHILTLKQGYGFKL